MLTVMSVTVSSTTIFDTTMTKTSVMLVILVAWYQSQLNHGYM